LVFVGRLSPVRYCLAAARGGVYVAVMRLRLLAVSFEADNPARAARFWAGLLGREVIEDGGGVLVSGGDAQLGLRFVPGRAGQPGANRMHLHLTSADLDDQRHTVATAVRLGGRHVDVGQRPEQGHVVLADPAGYEFCVIEPGNGYLAGCGPLGELTCAGTRQVGLFWSKALGWPWCGTGASRPRSSHRPAARKSHGTLGMARPWRRKRSRTGSASSCSRPTATSGLRSTR
jgi:catechol 2,3-dioxygenase-like lactoylglutathione lyase family enzyme